MIDSRIGDATEVLKTIREPVDFLLLDNNYSNYFPCFRAIESQLTDGATVVADNVGIGAAGMADYLNMSVPIMKVESTGLRQICLGSSVMLWR